MLLLAFPDLKRTTGPVTDALQAMGAEEPVLAEWQNVVAKKIHAGAEDEEF